MLHKKLFDQSNDNINDLSRWWEILWSFNYYTFVAKWDLKYFGSNIWSFSYSQFSGKKKYASNRLQKCKNKILFSYKIRMY